MRHSEYRCKSKKCDRCDILLNEITIKRIPDFSGNKQKYCNLIKIIEDIVFSEYEYFNPTDDINSYGWWGDDVYRGTP